MQMIDSKAIYDEARTIRQKCMSNQEEEKTLWKAYLNLLRTMFCELVLDRESCLITHLCQEVGTPFAAEHFTCYQGKDTTIYHWSLDLFTLLRGLSALLKGRTEDVRSNFDEYSAYLFTQKTPNQYTRLQIKNEITKFLREVDQNLGEMNGATPAWAGAQRPEIESFSPNRSQPRQTFSQENLEELRKNLNEKERNLNELRQRLNEQQQALEVQAQELEQAKARQSLDFQRAGQMPHSPKSPAHMEAFQLAEEKLRQFSRDRQADDSRLLDRLQKLQSNMQEGLQEIMRTREGIEYAAMQEAISQLLQLHELLWEILQFHLANWEKDWKKDYKEDYFNLVDSCKELQENIVQALAMLGVEEISSTGVPYDGKYHKAEQNVRVPVPRDAVVQRVIRPGFQYKERTLEKAVVEWK